MKLKLVTTDNTDHRETKLIMAQEGVAGSYFEVNVDPCDLIRNMIQNLPEPLCDRFEWLWSVVESQIEAEIELNDQGCEVKSTSDKFMSFLENLDSDGIEDWRDTIQSIYNRHNS